MDFPILSSLILLPILGSFFIFFSKSKSNSNLSSKYLALFVTFGNFVLPLYLWYLFDNSISEFQFVEIAGYTLEMDEMYDYSVLCSNLLI